MSLNIIDALKTKGSTGGNTITEAIDNLPSGSGEGGGCDCGVFVVHILDATFNPSTGAFAFEESRLDVDFNTIREHAVANNELVLAIPPITTIVNSNNNAIYDFAHMVPLYLSTLIQIPDIEFRVSFIMPATSYMDDASETYTFKSSSPDGILTYEAGTT